MINAFQSLSPVMQTLLATIFTWGVTALGAAIVFFFKKVNKTLMDALLGFAAGVMIAASFFSLISPAIEMANCRDRLSSRWTTFICWRQNL